MVLESLGKTGTSVAVIMREKEALTDPQQQIKEVVGSGPFKFAKDQWVPGSKAVYLKNADYVPRPGNEPPSSFAGSQGPEASTASSWSGSPIRRRRCRRSINGEIDFYEDPNIDFLPILEKAKGVKLMKTGKIDSTHGHDPAQPPASAVRQREGAPGDVLPDQPGGLPARHRRRSRSTTRVCHGLHRPAARPLENDGGSADDEGIQSEEGAAAPEGGRLQGRADHRAGGDRPQHHHAGDAGADPGDARGRHQRRRAVDGLGLGGLAPRQEGAAGAGRLEHLRHHLGRRRLGRTRCCTPGSARPATRACSAGRAIPRSRSCATPSASAIRTRRTQEDRPRPADSARWSRWSTSRSASGTQPLAYRADRIDGIVPNTGLVGAAGTSRKK